METIFESKQLTKTYKGRNVVNAVNMHVDRGDIYGFIGKNGAGKTTLMKMICGLISSSSGSFTLFGSNDLTEQRKKIGCVIEQPALYPGMTAYQNLCYYSKLLGMEKQTDPQKLLELVGLGDTGKKKSKNFSLGMKQRLSIAIALIGNPEFLVLDEPINGLDPSGIREVRELLLKLNQEKHMTILISSHILGELGKIATKYGIINNGNLVEEFQAEELENRTRHHLRLTVDNAERAVKLLADRAGVEQYKIEDDNTVYLFDNTNQAAEYNEILVKEGIRVSALVDEGEDMEMYFVKRMGGM